MLIGLPYSGKSKWVKEHRSDIPYELIDTDSIIEDWANEDHTSYNQSLFKYIKKASKEMFKRAMLAVELNHDIYWDQTNLTRKSRARKLIMIPDHYEKVAVVFPDITDEELIRRQDLRPEKMVRKNIINDMRESYESPMIDEGFGRIVDIHRSY